MSMYEFVKKNLNRKWWAQKVNREIVSDYLMENGIDINFSNTLKPISSARNLCLMFPDPENILGSVWEGIDDFDVEYYRIRFTEDEAQDSSYTYYLFIAEAVKRAHKEVQRINKIRDNKKQGLFNKKNKYANEVKRIRHEKRREIFFEILLEVLSRLE